MKKIQFSGEDWVTFHGEDIERVYEIPYMQNLLVQTSGGAYLLSKGEPHVATKLEDVSSKYGV